MTTAVTKLPDKFPAQDLCSSTRPSPTRFDRALSLLWVVSPDTSLLWSLVEGST
jgi:hypothetical protein